MDCKEYGKCSVVCKEMEKYLRTCGIYSSDYIRPQVSKEQWREDDRGRWREIPFSALKTIKNVKTAHNR